MKRTGVGRMALRKLPPRRGYADPAPRRHLYLETTVKSDRLVAVLMLRTPAVFPTANQAAAVITDGKLCCSACGAVLIENLHNARQAYLNAGLVLKHAEVCPGRPSENRADGEG